MAVLSSSGSIKERRWSMGTPEPWRMFFEKDNLFAFVATWFKVFQMTAWKGRLAKTPLQRSRQSPWCSHTCFFRLVCKKCNPLCPSNKVCLAGLLLLQRSNEINATLMRFLPNIGMLNRTASFVSITPTLQSATIASAESRFPEPPMPTSNTPSTCKCSCSKLLAASHTPSICKGSSSKLPSSAHVSWHYRGSSSLERPNHSGRRSLLCLCTLELRKSNFCTHVWDKCKEGLMEQWHCVPEVLQRMVQRPCKQQSLCFVGHAAGSTPQSLGNYA